jgi:hypothetical protein
LRGEIGAGAFGAEEGAVDGGGVDGGAGAAEEVGARSARARRPLAVRVAPVAERRWVPENRESRVSAREPVMVITLPPESTKLPGLADWDSPVEAEMAMVGSKSERAISTASSAVSVFNF